MLQGAQLNGETIEARIGGDLLVQSEQDSDHYASKQNHSSAGGALSYTDSAIAEVVTGKAIDANQSKINSYLSGSQKGYLEIDYKSSSPIGISISKGQENVSQVSNARIIIAKDPSMPTGYRVVTGYPTP